MRNTIRIDQLRTYGEVTQFLGKYRDVCDDFMFTLMLKQVYQIHELSKHSDEFLATKGNNSGKSHINRDSPREVRESPTTLPVTERLRKSIISRQKFFQAKEQLDLLRFLVYTLSVDTLRERQWTSFAKQVL